jgi:hypothetical protein
MGLAAGEKPKEAGRRKKAAASRKLDVKRVRIGLAGLLVVAAVVIGAIAIFSGGSGGGSSSSASSPGTPTNAKALSVSGLLAEAGRLGGPAYWVGPRAGTDSYELSSLPDGRVYIRYLTGGAKAGDPRPDFLTVGTYPVPEAKQALEGAAKQAGAGQTLSQHEGYEALSSSEATNAYVVFDDQPEVQIEIFSPQTGEAAALATSGELKPVG